LIGCGFSKNHNVNECTYNSRMDYLCGERGFHTAFLLEVFVFRDAQLWAHCQVSNLEDPQKFEKCERTVFRTQSRGV